MREPVLRQSMAVVTGLTLVLSLVPAADTLAVATATAAGIKITNPGGGPVPQTTVKITFNGETTTAKTDDDGLVAIVLQDRATARREDALGAVVLTGDGSGTITCDGGPANGESFLVRGGVLTIVGAASASSDGKGLQTKHYAIGGAIGGTLLLTAVALGGGDGSTPAAPVTPAAPAPPNVSAFYGNFTVTLAIGNSSRNNCGRAETTQIPVILTGNPDGSGFILSKGGLPFAGTMRPDGSFEALFAGGINGFPGLPNGTGVNWPIRGNVSGNQLNGSGTVTVTTDQCNGTTIPSTFAGARS